MSSAAAKGFYGSDIFRPQSTQQVALEENKSVRMPNIY